ncbi:MAG TPA: hypothetical protein VM489_01690 [Burkholderiales bacterium]|nr:hypothetical protein [Burkholderiales bacterium]
MKTFEFHPGLPGAAQKALADAVAAKINALFVRCPALCGFAVQDRAGLPKDVDPNRIPDADLFVTEIGIFPKLDGEQYGEIYDEITLAISDLVYEQPQAYDYLRGRTFARTLH